MTGRYVFKKKTFRCLAFLLDSIGYPLFFFSRRPKIEKQAFKNILLVRLDHLGDVLMASDTARLVKHKYPAAKVTFLCSRAAQPLLENNPHIDEVLVFDAPWFSRSGRSTSQGFWKEIHLLKAKNFDAVLGFRGDLRENLMFWAAKIPCRFGYGTTGGGFFLTDEAEFDPEAHESQNYLKILKIAGISAELLKPQIYFSQKETEGIPSFLIKQGLAPNKKYFGIQLDAGTTAKEWPQEQAQTFLKALAQKFPDRGGVLLGSDPKRFAWVKNFLTEERLGGYYLDLRGKTDLRELFVISKAMNVFIGPDSGPAHVAASLGLPTVFLYSGTNEIERWKPLEKNTHFLKKDVVCQPCALTLCPVQGHPCMSGISPQEVLIVAERAAS